MSGQPLTLFHNDGGTFSSTKMHVRPDDIIELLDETIKSQDLTLSDNNVTKLKNFINRTEGDVDQVLNGLRLKSSQLREMTLTAKDTGYIGANNMIHAIDTISGAIVDHLVLDALNRPSADEINKARTDMGYIAKSKMVNPGSHLSEIDAHFYNEGVRDVVKEINSLDYGEDIYSALMVGLAKAYNSKDPFRIAGAEEAVDAAKPYALDVSDKFTNQAKSKLAQDVLDLTEKAESTVAKDELNVLSNLIGTYKGNDIGSIGLLVEQKADYFRTIRFGIVNNKDLRDVYKAVANHVEDSLLKMEGGAQIAGHTQHEIPPEGFSENRVSSKVSDLRI